MRSINAGAVTRWVLRPSRKLIGLTGDEGLRRLVARYPSRPVDVHDPGVVIDIDTSEDLDEQRNSSDAGFKPSAFSPPIC